MRTKWMTLAVVCVALVAMTGCDLEALVTQPDAVQAVIREQADLIIGAASNWWMFATEFIGSLPI